MGGHTWGHNRDMTPGTQRESTLSIGDVRLSGDLVVPAGASGAVIFAHGSGSSRHSPRNQRVARHLQDAGFATLLFDLLEPAEAADRSKVFDIPLLAGRLSLATDWIRGQPETRDLALGYFGASTGAAAALWAAADRGPAISAVVSRGGRPDLAAPRLAGVRAPTLLIVGGRDAEVLELNRQAAAELRCQVEVITVPRAGHLFEEPGALEAASGHAAGWFLRYL